MINNKRTNPLRMVFSFIVIFVLGLVAYFYFLWNPLSGWVFENITVKIGLEHIVPDSFGNYPGGFLTMLLALVVHIILFIIPYLVVFGIILIGTCVFRLNRTREK